MQALLHSNHHYDHGPWSSQALHGTCVEVVKILDEHVSWNQKKDILLIKWLANTSLVCWDYCSMHETSTHSLNWDRVHAVRMPMSPHLTFLQHFSNCHFCSIHGWTGAIGLVMSLSITIVAGKHLECTCLVKAISNVFDYSNPLLHHLAIGLHHCKKVPMHQDVGNELKYSATCRGS